MELMMRQMGMTEGLDMYKDPGKLVLNAGNELVQYVMDNPDGKNTELVLEQLYDLARLGNAPLSSDDMTKFIARSNKVMLLLAGIDK